MQHENNPTDIREQEEAQALQADADRLAHELEVADLKWLLSDKRGRRFFWRLLGLTHVFHSSLNTNSIAMAFKEGERNIGLQYWAQLQEHAPKAYADMVKEHTDGKRNSGNVAATNKR